MFGWVVWAEVLMRWEVGVGGCGASCNVFRVSLSSCEALLSPMMAEYADWKIHDNHDLYNAYLKRDGDPLTITLFRLTWSEDIDPAEPEDMDPAAEELVLARIANAR